MKRCAFTHRKKHDTTMSTQRGNVKKGPPKHQNTFAYKHNPKSKKTEKILSLPIRGLCEKCHAQIEWRKKYRKYKPLTKPATCNFCHQKSVTSAYHVACDRCAKDRNVCAKCCLSRDIVPSREEVVAKKQLEEKEFEAQLEGMRERERRAILRKLEKEREGRDEATYEDGCDGESYDEEDFMDDE